MQSAAQLTWAPEPAMCRLKFIDSPAPIALCKLHLKWDQPTVTAVASEAALKQQLHTLKCLLLSGGMREGHSSTILLHRLT